MREVGKVIWEYRREGAFQILGSSAAAWAYAFGFLAVLVLLVWGGFLVALPGRIETALSGVAKYGPWTRAVVFGLAFVLAVQLFVPVTPLMVGAALAFGPLWGFVAVQLGSVLAAAVGFLLARHLGRGTVAKLLRSRFRGAAAPALFEGDCPTLLLCVRLLPFLPPALINYSLGLGRVRLVPYLLWSAIGMLPINGCIVLGADALYDILSSSRGWPEFLLASALVLAVPSLGLFGRRAWRERAPAQSRGDRAGECTQN